jgi:hypothetical protein
MKDERSIEPLITILGYNADFTFQINAIESLETLGDKRAIKPLVNVVVTDKNNSVVDRAMMALLKLDHLTAVEPLVVALNRKDEDYHIRMKAAAMLGHLKNEHATDPLISALQDEVWNVRATVAWALGEIGDSRAVQPLSNLLQDSNYTVQKDAKQALASIEHSVAQKGSNEKAAKPTEPVNNDANQIEFGEATTICLFPKDLEKNFERQVKFLKECAVLNIIPKVNIYSMLAKREDNPETRILVITGVADEYQKYLKMFYHPQAEDAFKRLFNSDDWSIMNPIKSLPNVPNPGWRIPTLEPFNNKMKEIESGEYDLIECLYTCPK